MKHTVEEIKGMSDRELNIAITRLTGGEFIDYSKIPEDEWPLHTVHYVEEYGFPNPVNYCSDWSVTGPLMVEYGVATIAEDGKIIGATTNSQEFYEPFGAEVFSSLNENPLRAICEVLLMIGDKPCS